MRVKALVRLPRHQPTRLGQSFSNSRRAVSRVATGKLHFPGLVADQIIAVLGGPPDHPSKIGDRYRFTACQAHSCTQKGAAVLDPVGRLVALALLHSSCGDARPATDCYSHDTLTVFTRAPAEPDVVNDLSSWASSEIAHEYALLGLRATSLDAVKIETVRYRY